MHPHDVDVANGLLALLGFEIHLRNRTLAGDNAVRLGVEGEQRLLGGVESRDNGDDFFFGDSHVRTPRGSDTRSCGTRRRGR